MVELYFSAGETRFLGGGRRRGRSRVAGGLGCGSPLAPANP